MSTSIETVARRLRDNLSLLEQLHVLSQTQTLLLETGDLTKLGAIVEAKDAIVARIVQAEKELDSLQADTELKSSGIEVLVALKEQGLQLIARISSVERTNQQHLEKLRADLIRRSENLQADRKIQEAYGQFS
jgi:hypothetical protein